MLIGDLWDSLHEGRYKGEPTRCLLFTTRSAARAWCVAAKAKNNYHSPHWIFRAISVREVVEPTPPTQPPANQGK